MAASQIGDVYVIVDEGYRADPFSGAVTFERTFDGTSADILALTATLLAQGARVSRRNSGGQNVLVAQWNRDPDGSVSDEVPADIWDDDTLTEEVDLFDVDAAVAEAATYVSAALYRKDITDAVNDGESFPLDSNSYAVGLQIYNYLARGIKSIPLNRPVLTRNRSFSATYEGRNQMEYLQRVWTSAALISEFEIPQAVQDRMPDDPSPVSDTEYVWGWKLTVDRSSYNTATGKIQETRSWTYGKAIRAFYTVTGL